MATMEGGEKASAGSCSASGENREVAAAAPEGNEAPTEEKLAAEEAEGDEEEEEEEEEEEGDEEVCAVGFVPGPLIPLKEQLEKDKDDESLKRWKEKLLGCVEGELNGQTEPEVMFHSIGIISEGCDEVVTPLPVAENQRIVFTLKEGSQYQLKLSFSVKHNIVSGLSYLNKVFKKGLQVDQKKRMLGTFAPQREPYEQMLEEETTPSGILARGMYSARLKFEDDDKRCHLELDYSFEIKKR